MPRVFASSTWRVVTGLDGLKTMQVDPRIVDLPQPFVLHVRHSQCRWSDMKARISERPQVPLHSIKSFLQFELSLQFLEGGDIVSVHDHGDSRSCNTSRTGVGIKRTLLLSLTGQAARIEAGTNQLRLHRRTNAHERSLLLLEAQALQQTEIETKEPEASQAVTAAHSTAASWDESK